MSRHARRQRTFFATATTAGTVATTTASGLVLVPATALVVFAVAGALFLDGVGQHTALARRPIRGHAIVVSPRYRTGYDGPVVTPRPVQRQPTQEPTP